MVKAHNINSLAEILAAAIFTGEHRDPVSRQPDPHFWQGVRNDIDEIVADDIADIKTIADIERERIRQEIARAREKMLADIDKHMALHMQTLETAINEAFRTCSTPEDKAAEIVSSINRATGERLEQDLNHLDGTLATNEKCMTRQISLVARNALNHQ